jgi:adenine deaminase
VERHGVNGNIGLGIVEGIGLKCGAVASSVAHDCHNIIVVGANTKDMAVCVNAIADAGGGFAAVKDGEVQSLVPFEVAGMITEAPFEEVVEKLDHFEQHIKSEYGFNEEVDFIVFNFIVLQSTPFEAAITDRGLIDVKSLSIVPLIISASGE